MQPYRILLIEPSETVAAPIRALLEQNNFEVEVAGSSAEAGDLARYSLLVIDIRSGDRESLSFVHRLDGEQSHLTGRVVVISADDSEALARELTALGVCDIIPKPVNAQEIVRAVFECLEKNPVLAIQ